MFSFGRCKTTGRLPALPLVGLFTLWISGCSSPVETVREPSSSETGTEGAETLYVSPDSYDFSQNPTLLERILSSPYGYFRFTNREFSRVVCRRFKDDMPLIPAVNLHGDAHLEQYTVTEVGRGLVDFDDSSVGPAVLDWARFGVSVRLACRAHEWEGHAEEILAEFFRGYTEALREPHLEPTPPPLAERIRSTFEVGRTQALERAEALMEPLEPEDMRALTSAAREQYVKRMLVSYPELPDSFFTTKSIGRLRMGIGSALDIKYLMRVEGPTSSPDDDVILEAKEVRDLGSIECIQPQPGDPFRLLSAQSRLSYQPYPFVGYEIIHPRKGDERAITLWVHGWFDNYRELSVVEDLKSIEDLRTVAYDVGVQLGLGHPREIANPHGRELRYALLECTDELQDDVREVINDLTGMTLSAWERFRAAVESR